MLSRSTPFDTLKNNCVDCYIIYVLLDCARFSLYFACNISSWDCSSLLFEAFLGTGAYFGFPGIQQSKLSEPSRAHHHQQQRRPRHWWLLSSALLAASVKDTSHHLRESIMEALNTIQGSVRLITRWTWHRGKNGISIKFTWFNMIPELMLY